MRFGFKHGDHGFGPGMGRDCGPFGGHMGHGRGGGRGFGLHGGRGRRRMFDADSLRLILLKLLSDSPRHGYDLIREVEERSGGAYVPSPGVVYPTLTLIADMGHAAEQPATSGRRLYAITPEGEAHLAEQAEAVAAAMERLAALATDAKRTNGAPIRRAMENLKMALGERLQREGVDEEAMLGVAAIIDEAAQKIERLK